MLSERPIKILPSELEGPIRAGETSGFGILGDDGLGDDHVSEKNFRVEKRGEPPMEKSPCPEASEAAPKDSGAAGGTAIPKHAGFSANNAPRSAVFSLVTNLSTFD